MTKLEVKEFSDGLSGLYDTKNAFVRITGATSELGDQLATNKIAAMYKGFAEKVGLSVSVSESIGADFRKSITLQFSPGMSGLKPFGLLKNETGNARIRETGINGNRIEGMALVEVVPESDGMLYVRAIAPYASKYATRSYVQLPYKSARDMVTGYDTPDVEGVLSGDLFEFIKKNGIPMPTAPVRRPQDG